MNIMEALQWGNNKLRKVGVDSPMLDAEILLSHALDVSKAWIFAHFSQEIKAHQEERFRSLIEQRSAREPVAYLTQKKAFFGRDFFVNSCVLIPRPETETLIEAALEILKDADADRTLICDIGTGSGIIAATLALQTGLPVIAIDTDKQALEVAQKNIALLHADERVDAQHGHLALPLIALFKTIRGQKNIETSSVYPFKHLLIAANLPYLPEGRLETLAPEIKNFEPHHALFAGADGLDAYFELFQQLQSNRAVLPKRVSIVLEMDPDQRMSLEKLMKHKFPRCVCDVRKDLHGLDRVMEVEI